MAFARLADDAQRDFASIEMIGMTIVPAVEHLVGIEELSYLVDLIFRYVVECVDLVEAGVVERHADQFGLQARGARSPTHADRTRRDANPRKGGFIEELKRVERVAVGAECAPDESVVGREGH